MHPTACLQDNTTMRAWWVDFKQYYNKTYSTPAAEATAFQNFRQNMKRVKQINGNSDLAYWASGNA